MRALKIFLFCGFLVFLGGVLTAAYFFFVRPMTLPVYQLGQRPADGTNFVTNTLMLGKNIYVSGPAEFPLEMTAARSNQIGRTQDGMDVYAVPQQDPHDYIMLTTEMFPNEIFRNADLPPFQPGNVAIDEIHLFQSQMPGAAVYKTREPAVIAEVVDSLTHPGNITRNLEAFQAANLYLVSDVVPGLGYFVYAYAMPDGKVYLAEKVSPTDWIAAGPLFTGWFRQQPLKLLR